MSSFRGQYDTYDDTGYAQQQQRQYQRQSRSSNRRRSHSNNNSNNNGHSQQQQQQHVRNYVHDGRYYPSQQINNAMPQIDPFVHYGQAPQHVPVPHHHHHHQQQHQSSLMDPFGMLSAHTNGGLFNSVQNMMSSFDTMFDTMSQQINPHQHQSSSSSSTYFYESRTTTVGPDGRVREEVIREQPGTDGRPETVRHIRETDQYGRQLPSNSNNNNNNGNNNDTNNSNDNLPDVVVEELDEHGNVINSNIDQHQNENDNNRDRNSRWWFNRQTRGNRA